MSVRPIRQDEMWPIVVPDLDLFDSFWVLYPKKNAKLDARKAWRAIAPELYVDIIIATAAWRLVWLKRDEMQYVPLPASWLRGERWEDELPNDGQRPAAAAHVLFAPIDEPQAGKRGIPEHVLTMIRKITGQRD